MPSSARRSRPHGCYGQRCSLEPVMGVDATQVEKPDAPADGLGVSGQCGDDEEGAVAMGTEPFAQPAVRR